MNVLVYSGPGVSSASLTHTISSLRTALSTAYAVQPILPQALIKEPWAASCALLVIPGGRDLPYVSALTQGIPRIKDYVKNGGKFMGLCAGAYFACEVCEFERGTELEVVGKRELGFFPGTCEGCTFPGFKYESEDGARVIDLTLDVDAWGEEGKRLEKAVKGIYYNGGGHFIPTSESSISSGLVKVLARYADPPSPGKSIATVLCRVGRGLAFLSSPHIEYPLAQEPARSAMDKFRPNATAEERSKMESARVALVFAAVRLLGLVPPPPTLSTAPPLPTTPLPQFLVSSPARPDLAGSTFDLLKRIAVKSETTSAPEIRDANDTFHLHLPEAANALLLEARTRFIDETPLSDGHVPKDFPKMIIAYMEGAIPGTEQAPLFDLKAYFEELEIARKEIGLAKEEENTEGASAGSSQPSGGPINLPNRPSGHSASSILPIRPPVHSGVSILPIRPSGDSGVSILPIERIPPIWQQEGYDGTYGVAERQKAEEAGRAKKLAGGEPWGMGQVMFYGEVVTSTQTMLDRNPSLLSTLPTPFLSLATYQLTGRGRGANVWLSPSGCLQFSLHIRPPSSFPASKLVFIQYLFGIAVVDACKTVLTKLGGGDVVQKVKLKWPNDIYGIVEKGERKKLGGILVGTTHLQGRFEVVIGCGLNVLNTQPTTSLKHLLELSGSSRVSELNLEKVLATILPTFEGMWSDLVAHRGDFRTFESQYLSCWLHSDQVVKLTTVTPSISVRIVGITLDYGLLRTVPAERDPWKRRTVEGEQFIDLQPDGNSFDMIEGLIKRKI